MNKILDISQITKIYETKKEKIIGIKDVSFSVEEGEFISIIGPSGCGKSTLLRCIAGFEKINNGSILLEGKNVAKPSPERFMIFQGLDQLFPWLTLRENINFAMKAVGKNSVKGKADYFLQTVRLSGFENFYPYQLSGGMKQRASIARALSVEPRVLLMDEPFGSLDAFSRKSIHKIFMDIWEKTKVTVIFVTHDMEEAIDLSDRILVFTSGRLKNDIKNPLPRPREKDTNYRNFFLMISGLLDEELDDSSLDTKLSSTEATFAF